MRLEGLRLHHRAPWILVLLAGTASCSSPGTPGPNPPTVNPPGASVPARSTPTPGAATAGPGIDVVELTTTDIQTAYAAGDYSSVELTQAFLSRIDMYEDHYNAFISMNPDALAVAEALDREYAARGPRGPLHGVPIVIKDNIDYAGLVTTNGFSGFSSATGGVDMIPGDHAAVVDRLVEAGAIILGKTNMPDFAAHGTRTNSSVAGVTLNPYNVDKAPGGSSGGTATAVAGSFAVLGLGTETGGSIQNPASAQALVGFKPTFGLVPLEGVVPSNATYVDVVGPLARNVVDAAVTLDVIAGPSDEDLATYASDGHMPDEGYAASLSDVALRGKRFGLVGPGWRESFLPLATETEAHYRRAIQVLEAQGASVVEDPFAGTPFLEVYDSRPRVSVGAHDMHVYFQGLGEGAAFHTAQEWEALSGQTFRGGRGGVPARPSATEAGDAFQAWRQEIREIFRKVLEDNRLDGLFFPQAGAPIRDLIEDPERPDFNPNNHPELPSNTINDIGLPVVTVPFAYYDDSTPFAVAFIGDLWADALLFGWAYDFEAATHARKPPILKR